MKMLDTVKYLIGSAGPSGYSSKTTADQVTETCPNLHSITAIITGATSGIGGETARVLAKRGARLVLPARDVTAGEEARARILSDYPNSDILVIQLDLSNLASVRNFVSHFLSLQFPLNLLINNAGKFCNKHALTQVDGIEMTFATNYLGHFLLTKLLLDKMVKTAKESGIQGRIVNVSSHTHTWFSGDIIQYLQLITANNMAYDATQAYALSKLANILHAKELAVKLKQMGANVTANCLHPGIAKTRLTRERHRFITDIVFFLSSKLLKTIPQAAATICYVAAHPGVVDVSGKYFVDCNEASPSELGLNATEAARLWSFSEVMIGQDPIPKMDLLQLN